MSALWATAPQRHPVMPNSSERCFCSAFPTCAASASCCFSAASIPRRGVDLLIEAFAAVASSDPRLQLVIAGPDQVGWQAALQRRAAELGIAERITWAGMISGELKWGAFRCAELFCLPSHQENFGIVVAEALACGLPVAIAEPVNISAEVATARAGLVHVDNTAGTTAALRQWLALPIAEHVQMGRRGAQLFADSFDFASVACALMPVLESAIGGKPMDKN